MKESIGAHSRPIPPTNQSIEKRNAHALTSAEGNLILFTPIRF